MIIDDHQVVSLGVRSALLDAGAADEALWLPAVDLARIPAGAVVVLDLRLNDGSSPRDNITALSGAGHPVVVYTFADDRNLIHETPLDRLEAKISCPDKSFIDSLMRVEVAATAAHFSGAKPLVVVRRRGREPQLVGREVIPTQQSPEATRVTVEDLGDDAM